MSLNSEKVLTERLLTESVVTKAWRTDTKALVGAVILGVVSMLLQQVSMRIDAAIWTPLIILGGITWATLTGLITLIFRQPAGIIMGETQALIAMATGLSPVALFFIPANGFSSLAYTLVARKLSMQKWSHHFLAQLATNVVGNIFVGYGLHVVLKLPVNVAVVSSLITCCAGIIGATILTKKIADALNKAGLA
ncbi:MAG: hypothetical protein RO469_01735 [Thermincola sp.]|jgi:hypothetical protein|nr:hypothetical protein [Thermincola sp.]MDT3702374.1 hypothetical protein [Thermincola sp.]